MAQDNSGTIYVTRSYVQCGKCKGEFSALPDTTSGPLTPDAVEKAYRAQGWRKHTPSKENNIAGEGWACPTCSSALRKTAMHRQLRLGSPLLTPAPARSMSSSSGSSSSGSSSSQFDPPDGSPYEDWEMNT